MLSSATAKDSLIMMIGFVISAFFSFLMLVILTRNLNTFNFGLFVTALTFTQLVSDFFEMGINAATLNFLTPSEGGKKMSYLKSLLITKAVTAFFVSIGVYLLAPFISTSILNNFQILPLIQISSIGIFLLMFILWLQVVYQADKNFVVASFINFSGNVLRVLGLLILFYLGFFNFISGYLSIQLILIPVVLVAFYMVGIKYLNTKDPVTHIRQVLKFSLPVGLSFSMWAIYSRLDQILVLQLKGAEEAGVYGLAFRIISVLLLVSSALNNAIAPRFASIAHDEFGAYFKKTLLASLGLVFLAILSIPFAPIVLPLIFGANFYHSVLPFQLLVIATAFFIFASPINYAILYRYKNTHFALWTSVLYLGIIWILLNIFVPLQGSVGAALSVLILNMIQLVVSVGYFIYLQRSSGNVGIFNKSTY